MTKLKAIIIDDESKARLLLRTILNEYCENIEIIGFSDNINEAIYLIKTQTPNIIFIDIEMKGETGFDLFQKIEIPKNTFIVFVTAFKEYAIQAIKNGAFDYILKPIDIDEITALIERIESHNYENTNIKRETIPLSYRGEIHYIKTEEIIYLKAEGRYTSITTNEQKNYIQTKHLGAYQKELDSTDFIRVHKSYLVNKKFIKSINKHSGKITLSNNLEIDISKRNLSLF